MSFSLFDISVKRREGETEPEFRERGGRFASAVGVFANLLLAGAKIASGVISGSVAIVGDAVNNLSDILSYVISYISFRVSARPADREHPYGHARFEYVASLFVAFILIVVAYRLGASSVSRIGSDEKLVYPAIVIAFLAASVLVKLWLFVFYRRLAKRFDSTVLRASSADCIADVLSTSMILVSIAISELFGVNTDGWMGLLVAAFILYSAYKIIREAMDKILGSPESDAEKETISEMAMSFPEVKGVHDILIHSYGTGMRFCSLHVEVDGISDIHTGHEIADGIERAVKDKLGLECTVHIDPIELDSAEYENAKNAVEEVRRRVGAEFTVHDLRLVRANGKSTVVFDIAVPYETKLSDTELRNAFSESLKAYPESYDSVITVDRQ
ncbi:MAG: cation transporter [Clostridia bacterium]|nr:cation transporter [Clostridia bacterium]